jgi:hypothetical protein
MGTRWPWRRRCSASARSSCGRLDDTRIYEEESETGIGRWLVEDDFEHPHEIERAERLHDVRGRPDRARKGATLRIVTRGQHDDADVARLWRAAELATNNEAVTLRSGEDDIKEHDLGLLPSRDRERFARRRGFEHAPALCHEGDAHEGADRAVVISNEHAGRAHIRRPRLVPHHKNSCASAN